jgi:hypothetical protein
MKALGSFIGSNAYVEQKLSDILTQYSRIKECLLSFPIAQERMLLFRYCFSTKPVHILRTIPFRLTENFVSAFVAMQKEILESMVNQPVDGVFMRLAALPIEQGGLGILNYHDIHRIAHIASVFGSATFSTIFKDHLQERVVTHNLNNSLGPFATELFQLASTLTEYLGLPETTSLLNIVNALVRYRKQAIRDRSTFQSSLYLLLNNKKDKKEELEQLLIDADPTQCRLMSYRNTLNSSAGMWLRTRCQFDKFHMSNNEFCVALCLRYHLKIPLIRNTERQCPCCKGKKKGPNRGEIKYKPDAYGHHFASACMNDIQGEDGSKQSAQPHAVHDSVRNQLYQLLVQALAMDVIQEPESMLRIEGANKQLRPDIGATLLSKDMQHVRYAIDVGLTSPFIGSREGKIEVDHHPTKPELTHNKRAFDRKQSKLDKYQEVCRLKNCVFIPFIMYTTGKIHKNGINLLRTMARNASEHRDIPEQTLFKYYIKVLNFTMIKSVAKVICLKAVCSVDTKSARQGTNATLRAVNKLVLSMSEQPHVSLHHIFPDM